MSSKWGIYIAKGQVYQVRMIKKMVLLTPDGNEVTIEADKMKPEDGSIYLDTRRYFSYRGRKRVVVYGPAKPIGYLETSVGMINAEEAKHLIAEGFIDEGERT